MSSAPPLDNSVSALSPLLSIKVTPVRSTTHLRSRRAGCVCVQRDFSSETNGWTSRPSTVHFCSDSVSAIVIRNIPITRFFRPVLLLFGHRDLSFALFPNRWPSRTGRVPRTLAHMNFRPAPGKVHFVHIRFHQLDAVLV